MKSAILAALAASVILCLFLGVAAFARARTKHRFYALGALCFSAAIYAAFYAAEIVQPTLQGVLFCIGFEYLGISGIAVTMFFVIRDFVGSERPSPSFIALVTLVPFITSVLALTVSHHEWLYIAPHISRVSGLSILGFSKGPWYWVNLLYIYAIFGYGLLEFIRTFLGGRTERKVQAAYLLAAFAIPIAGNIIYLAGWTPAGIDAAPIAFAFSVALSSASFFKHHLFNIHPLARDLVFEQMRDAAFVVAEDGAVIDSNAAARELFPALAIDTGSDTLQGILSAHPEFGTASEATSSNPVLTISHDDGTNRFLEIRRSEITGRNGRLIGQVYTLIDITESKYLQDRLEELASTDELTGLPNRRRFFELAAVELERARRHARPIGFAIMDMNKFKDINDRLGHRAGDEALRLAARLCAGTLRSCDAVCRIGGDEFAFVFPECDEAGAAAAAEKIRAVIGSATFTSGPYLITLSASIGSTGSSGPVHPDLEEMLATADRRMYQQKSRAESIARRMGGKTGLAS
jgi:diguanylate cyclase (GGDEF)-like protein